MSLPIPMGTPVRWRNALYRADVPRALGDWSSPLRREWRSVTGGEGQAGFVIGWRTLSNGEVRRYGYEPTEYIPERHFDAYLVVFDPRTNPVYVLPENVEPA